MMRVNIRYERSSVTRNCRILVNEHHYDDDANKTYDYVVLEEE